MIKRKWRLEECWLWLKQRFIHRWEASSSSLLTHCHLFGINATIWIWMQQRTPQSMTLIGLTWLFFIFLRIRKRCKTIPRKWRQIIRWKVLRDIKYNWIAMWWIITITVKSWLYIANKKRMDDENGWLGELFNILQHKENWVRNKLIEPLLSQLIGQKKIHGNEWWERMQNCFFFAWDNWEEGTIA